MAEKVNLNKLKDEIDNRKKEKNMVSSTLGESVGTNVAPRDVFLHGLMESLNTGRNNASSTLIKSVENTVSKKKGENAKHIINPTPAPTHQHTNTGMSPERDQQFNTDMSKTTQTLAESIQGFQGSQNIQNQPSMVNYNGQQMLTSAPVNTQQVGAQINEDTLNESVRKIVNNHLVENFGPVLEEAIKNTVIEMYAVERIKLVLNENKDLIKTVVYETIRELQKKKKLQ